MIGLNCRFWVFIMKHQDSIACLGYLNWGGSVRAVHFQSVKSNLKPNQTLGFFEYVYYFPFLGILALNPLAIRTQPILSDHLCHCQTNIFAAPQR
jgi:hypothetical protein